MTIRRSFRHVLGTKPVKPNPWRKCTQCHRRTPPDAMCPTCQSCGTCCHKCGRCHRCPLACPGHEENR